MTMTKSMEIKLDNPIKTFGGDEYDILVLAQYESNDSAYVGMNKSKNRLPFPTDITTNMQFLPEDCLILDVNNLYLESYRDLKKTLLDHGIIKELEPLQTVKSGFVNYPVFVVGKTVEDFLSETAK